MASQGVHKCLPSPEANSTADISNSSESLPPRRSHHMANFGQKTRTKRQQVNKFIITTYGGILPLRPLPLSTFPLIGFCCVLALMQVSAQALDTKDHTQRHGDAVCKGISEGCFPSCTIHRPLRAGCFVQCDFSIPALSNMTLQF